MNEAYRQERTRWFLREWRKHFHLSLEKLAEMMGTTKSNLSKLERKRTFKTHWIDRYCAALSQHAQRCITAKELSRHPSSMGPLPADIERAIETLRSVLDSPSHG